MVELNDLLGLPLDTKLDLESEADANFETLPKAEYVKEAWEENPEIRAAEEAVEKARAGVAASKNGVHSGQSLHLRATATRTVCRSSFITSAPSE